MIWEQSDLGPYCLLYKLPKFLPADENVDDIHCEL